MWRAVRLGPSGSPQLSLCAKTMQWRNYRHFSRLGAFLSQIRCNESACMSERIVAVGLLTRRDLEVLGPTFDRIWTVEEAPQFNELLKAIDSADRILQHQQPDRRIG